MNQDNRPPAAVRDQQPSANAADDEAAAVETRAMRKKSSPTPFDSMIRVR